MIDIYWFGIPDEATYQVVMLGQAHLRYKTKEDLDKLLKLSSSDKVIVKKFGSIEPGRKITLEEACGIFGSEVVAEHWNPRMSPERDYYPPKTIDLLSKKIIEWEESA